MDSGLLCYCRAGFEPELAAELAERAAHADLPGYARTERSSAFVQFMCEDAQALSHRLPLSHLIFARQKLVQLAEVPTLGAQREGRPDRVGAIAPIATCTQASAQQIAWGAIGRRAIRMDPKWRGGDYYDAPEGDGPWEGLATARMVAQVTFRSDNVFTDRFGRELADGATLHDSLDLWQRFEVERYLDYHGDKLVRRFDTNSYLIIGKAMDLHDVGRGRSGLGAAMARVAAPALVMGINSDILYPTYQQRQIHELLLAGGTKSDYLEIDSPHGHDAFLINLEQVGPPLTAFLDQLPVGR